jgi:Fe-S cluster assembly protein SufD
MTDNLISDFQQQALTLAEQQSSPEWLAGLRRQGAELWSSTRWPTRKTEHWKYTPLAPLQKAGVSQWAEGATGWKDELDLLDVDATRLVFVNGVFAPEHSSELPAEVVRFSAAEGAAREVIEKHLGKVVDAEKHLFAALSNAWASEGVLLHVPASQPLEKPLYVVHVSTPTAEPASANQRLLLVLENNARAEVIEHFVSGATEQNGFVNALTEVVVGENAELQHYRLNLEEENLLHVGGVHVDLQRSARLRAFTIAQGSRLKRIDYQMNHKGEGAELDLQGLYLPRNKQVIDYHTEIRHMVPHCTSKEVFHGIVGDSAKAVFNGRIYIHPQAQKTLAELSNKNLLTSNKAEVDTKPELEIYADDVKCAHGATVSQLNLTALYYLQSRGIPRAEAEVMLNFGFINELLQQVAQPAVRAYLGPRLAQLFSPNSELLRHISYE